MTKIQSLPMIDPDNFEETAASYVKPQLEVLHLKNYTIAPGLSGSFWINMRNIKFAGMVLKSMLDWLVKDIEKSKVKETYTPPEYTERVLYTVINIAAHYGNEMPAENFKSAFSSLLGFNIPIINTVILKLQNMLTQPTTYRIILDGIISDNKSKLLNSTLPMAYFNRLLRQLYQNEADMPTFISDLKFRLEAASNVSEAVTLLHTIRVVLSLFPGQMRNAKSELLPLLVPYLSKPVPVSEMAHQLGVDLEREEKYPGAAYFSVLNALCRNNIAFNGTIPLIFDQKCTTFPNFISSRTTRFHNIQGSLINFIQFFLTDTFKVRKLPKLEHQASIVSYLAFDQPTLQQIVTKFKLHTDVKFEEPMKDDQPSKSEDDQKADNADQKDDQNADETEQKGDDDQKAKTSEHLPVINNCQPPMLPFKICRLSLIFKPNNMMVTPLQDGLFMYMTPMGTILEKEFIGEVKRRAAELTDPAALVSQPVLIAGDDFLLASFLEGLISATMADPEGMARVVLTIHLLPVDKAAVNEVSSFLGRADPVYHALAENAFLAASGTAPTHNEESTVDFIPVLERRPAFEANAWLCDPSPSVLLQAALQHYALFARRHVDVNIWACELVCDGDDKTILVPWLTSVHVGETFANSAQPPREISSKTTPNLTVEEVMQEPRTYERTKLRSISVWNIGGEMNVRPTDNWVYAEWTKEKFAIRGDERRAKYAGKITSKLVTGLTLAVPDPKMPPLYATIDQREYGPLRSIKVRRMPDPARPGQLMSLRFATFNTTN